MGTINLSKLKWVKVIHDPNGWAYTRKRLKELPNTVDYNGITIFPLGFRTDKATKLENGDLAALIQNGKLTHIVEILDNTPYQAGDWYNRMCRILWWKPDLENWSDLESQSHFFGFDPTLMDGAPHLIENLKRFNERWDKNGKMEGFRAYLAEHLATA